MARPKDTISTILLSIVTSIAMLLPASAQTLGGSAAYNFLLLPNTAQLSALGGINVSNISTDAGMAFNNPSLLREDMRNQLHLSFNNMYASVKNYHSAYAFRYDKWKTNFLAGVHFIDYGNITQTDASGNIYGNFRPTDYAAQISASREYEEKWYYGLAVKFISSNYGIYKSNAIAIDVGVSWYDSSRLLQVSLLAKNMGTQLKKYRNSTADDLPFDIQLGITKRLANAPVQFSLTAHHLHQFNIQYNDTAFNNSNDLSSYSGSFSLDKVFRHLVGAAQVFVSNRLEITLAYNYLLHKELSIANTSNGFTGLSFGAGILFTKMQLRYARNHYQNNTGYNQLALNLFFLR
ncbi:MAG: type IX secretion system protein PorQ [Chitinophagaceae bacterium]